MFRINQTREKEFILLGWTSYPVWQLFFFVLFLVICILFFPEILSLTLRITSSYYLFTDLPIPHTLVNFLFKKVISLINLFEQYNMLTFLLTQYFVSDAISDSHSHMIICFSCIYSIRFKVPYIYMAAILYISVSYRFV